MSLTAPKLRELLSAHGVPHGHCAEDKAALRELARTHCCVAEVAAAAGSMATAGAASAPPPLLPPPGLPFADCKSAASGWGFGARLDAGADGLPVSKLS